MKTTHPSTSKASAVLLVGGLGTRLRSVVSCAPKPLAPMGKSSFLALLVQQLRWQGIRQLILCVGYLAEQIESEFGDGSKWDVEIRYSKEAQPLGTAGALKLAQRSIGDCSDFLVLNGDSFLEIDFGHMLGFHRQAGGIGTIAICELQNAGRYGTVRMDDANRVIGFLEKAGSDRPGWINAGVYVFNRSIFEHIPVGHASLERDIFPRILQYKMYAFQSSGMFVDIGTPEDYAYAQRSFERLYQVALTAKQDFETGRGDPMLQSDDFEHQAASSIQASIRTKQRLLDDVELVRSIVAVSRLLIQAFEQGKKAIFFGNGGSAADAQHIAAEFVGRFAFERPALPSLALSVNTSSVTAIGNDYGFDKVFARQIEAFGVPGDVAIGISTSGNSPNVLCGIAAARKIGLHTIGFTGHSGGKLKGSGADYCLCAPSDETPRIQECHILIGHVIAELVERSIFHG